MRLPLGTADVDAFSLPFADRPVVVLGTDKGDKARSRFDAAHELGHLAMHGEQVWGLPIVEKQAHEFAAASLMPEADIYKALPSSADWPTLFELKMRWQVSLAALLMRARTVGRMSEANYIAAVKTASARGWRSSNPCRLASPSNLGRYGTSSTRTTVPWLEECCQLTQWICSDCGRGVGQFAHLWPASKRQAGPRRFLAAAAVSVPRASVRVSSSGSRPSSSRRAVRLSSVRRAAPSRPTLAWIQSSAFIAPRRDAMADAVAAHERYTCPMDPPLEISPSCVREERDDPSRDTDGRSRLHHTNPRKGRSHGKLVEFRGANVVQRRRRRLQRAAADEFTSTYGEPRRER